MRNTLILILLMAVPTVAAAQNDTYRRPGAWEWSVIGIYQESKSAGGNGGSSLDIDSAVGFGFNFSYYLSTKFSVGGDLEFLRPDYDAVLVDEAGIEDDLRISHSMSQFNGRLKATYNFLDKPFTPFVEAGLGWSYFDSNVTDGDPIVGCWWHPWWGYICEGFYNTYDDTQFAYGAGAGLRYEFAGGSFIKASYNVWELDGLGAGIDPTLSSGRIEFGWSF